MRFDIITLFPEVLKPYFSVSILNRAQEKKLVQIKLHQLRDFAADKHKTVDDAPYGGGAGMVLKAEPILEAIESVKRKAEKRNKKTLRLPLSAYRSKIVILSAKGRQFTQQMAYQWAKKYKNLVLISGRYEGIDERVKTILKAEEISIGPYVLTDGDAAAMVVVSAVTRLLPGAIRFESLQEESHWNSLLKNELKAKSYKLKASLEYPHYTRPEAIAWKGKKYHVPRVLLSGDHKKMQEWRDKNRK